MAEPTEMPFEG